MLLNYFQIRLFYILFRILFSVHSASSVSLSSYITLPADGCGARPLGPCLAFSAFNFAINNFEGGPAHDVQAKGRTETCA